MSYKITTSLPSPETLNETEEVLSILQNVSNILRTKKGTVPHYRDFGVEMEWLDKPVNVAQVMMQADVRENVEEFEPRVTVVGVTATVQEDAPGVIIPVVEVEINES